MPADDPIERVMYLERKKRVGIFVFIIIINVIANMDDGTLPAASNEIIRDIDISEEKVGLLGTLVYVGNLIG